jgi:hypothetical protein
MFFDGVWKASTLLKNLGGSALAELIAQNTANTLYIKKLGNLVI